MVGEIIKSYLVSLGVEIDKPGFDQMKTTLDKTSGTVVSATSSWTKNFVAAGTIIGAAVASITASIAGVMTAAAKQDLAMEKYARNMMVSKNAAMEMKTAIDALGESVQDIQLTPELMNRYKSLVGDGRQMKVGGDYEGTMKGFRDLIFEFTRLKQEASYALQWVGYYLMKYLSKPLSDAKVSFKSFNDSMIKNMPVWTEKVARALMYIINVGRHFWDLLKVIGKTVYDVWDGFPRGVKIATAAVAGFFMLLRASPIGRMVTLISTLLLMVDDYFGHAEGKNAALGTVWDKLNKYMETGKQKLQEWGNELVPMWDEFIGYLGEAKNGVIDFSDKCAEWFDEIEQSKALNDFLDVAKRLGKALYELGDGTIDLVTESCKNLFDSLEKQDSAKSFTELMQWLWDIFLGLVDVISEGTEIIAKWLEEMGRSEAMRDLIDASVELLNVIMDLISAIFDLCNEALGEFFKGMDKTEPVYTFRDAVKAVTEFITAMIRAVSSLIRWLRDLFGLVKNDKSFKEYWRAQGEAVQMFADIVFRALGAVGKLGKAVLALMSNKPGYAAKLAGEALDMLFGGGKAEGAGRRQGSGFAGTGDSQRDEWIKEASKKYGVPASKIAAMIETESTFKADAVSSVGAKGYMQLMPDTFKWMGFDDIDDPYQNIMAGTKYMAYLRDYYDSDWDKVYGSYNCGPGTFDAYLAGKKKLPAETRDHIERVRDRESKYWGKDPDISYSIQAGVEDNDLSGVNPNLRGNFNELAADLHGQGYDLEVSSGWRSPENNAAADGVPDSKHLGEDGFGTGQAIDFVINGEFDQTEIEKIIQEYGMKVLYHDVGSGLHFHVEMDPSIPQYNYKNPPEGMRDPTWFDEVKEKAGKVYDDITGFFTPSAYIKDAFASLDPLVMRGLIAGDTQTYAQNYGAGTVTNVTCKVDVGGVNVQNTNASPEEIGQAVGDKTANSLNSSATYLTKSKALCGGPSWA